MKMKTAAEQNASLAFSRLTPAHVQFIRQFGFVSFAIECEADLTISLKAEYIALVRMCYNAE